MTLTVPVGTENASSFGFFASPARSVSSPTAAPAKRLAVATDTEPSGAKRRAPITLPEPPAVQKVQDGVHAAGEALSQRAHDARELGDEWCESLRCTVRDNPLTAIATALAVGVLIARLTR